MDQGALHRDCHLGWGSSTSALLLGVLRFRPRGALLMLKPCKGGSGRFQRGSMLLLPTTHAHLHKSHTVLLYQIAERARFMLAQDQAGERERGEVGVYEGEVGSYAGEEGE